jgi:membrane-associated phospholipid phosphatase
VSGPGRLDGRPEQTADAPARARRPLAALWVALAGLALTVLTSLAARDGAVSAPERAVFRAINGLPGWLERPAWALQLLGVLITPILAAVVMLVTGRWRPAFGLVLLAPLKLLAEREVLKKLVERRRPGETEPGAILRDVPPAGLSYPSGHAIVAAGMVVLLWPYLGRAGRVVAVLLAISVCVARVYLGAHNPLDVVAGAGLGLLLGGLLTFLVGIHPGRRRSGR